MHHQSIGDKSDLTVIHSMWQAHPGSLLYWRVREVQRRVDDILDVETIAVTWGTNVATYLSFMALEIGLTRVFRRPLILSDSKDLITHIRSTNKHKNLKLNVVWHNLRTAYTQNQYALRWICGKSWKISDTLTKLKTGLAKLFSQTMRTGIIFVPRW